MNGSPTPKRYSSKSSRLYDDYYNIPYQYSNPTPMNRDYNDVGSRMNADKLVPEEYKRNTEFINKAVQQNKELNFKLREKQNEIFELKKIAETLRSKLEKYVDITKRLEDQNLNLQIKANDLEKKLSEANAIIKDKRYSNVKEPVIDENFVPQDYSQINLPKNRAPDGGINPRLNNKSSNGSEQDSRLKAIEKTLSVLTNYVMRTEENNNERASLPSPLNTISPINNRLDFQEQKKYNPTLKTNPSDDDIMMYESAELKRVEEEIEELKRKILVRKKHDLRKLSLNNQLQELQSMMDGNDNIKLDNHPNHNHNAHRHSSQSQRDCSPSSDACFECSSNGLYEKSKIKPENNTAETFATPTPNNR